jgi:hypothetical protein
MSHRVDGNFLFYPWRVLFRMPKRKKKKKKKKKEKSYMLCSRRAIATLPTGSAFRYIRQKPRLE